MPIAMGLACSLRTPLEVLGCDDLEPLVEEWELGANAAENWLGRYFDDLRPRLEAAGIAVTSTVVRGRADERILTRAREIDAGMIVMATHGHGGLSRIWLGSITDRVIRHTQRPVLAVHVVAEPESLLATDRPVEVLIPRTVLLALDGSEMAEDILPLAMQVAQAADSELHLMRVVPALPLLRSPYLDSPVIEEQSLETLAPAATEYLEGVAARLRAVGLQVHTHVEEDVGPASAILACAERERVDLIAMTTHGRGRIARALVGSVADKVVRGGTIPVLLLPRRPE